ncbi:WG repeat-containing protein [Hymenobacter oligotrophus]|uniref:WG repeat-containing protein n=1 Tax=Hymenobacter oligotrophus TaxID=2319843 RepID=A0A3B7R993_9BACT|nr:WG repeat-containing protein [Hymenobacter oligotrophus]AYA37671.1 WG repeat-containing protein [Hymenobacter oligotrophus]
MLHVFQSVTFSDPARQALFEAVRDALQASAQTSQADALLAGPLRLPNSSAVDALLVRPHSLTLLVLHPGAGELSISSFAGSTWQLNGVPLPAGGAVNPYVAFQEQREAVLQLIGPLMPPDALNSRFVTGLWVPTGPVRFGTDVEASMAEAPEARQFQLLPEVARLPRRLAQLATPEIELTAADIRHLAEALPGALGAPNAAEHKNGPRTFGSLMHNSARQLWRWIGAEDIDSLSPDTYELAAQTEDRKHELEQQQAALQQQLAEQVRALEAREAAREQSMAQLRTQLAQAQAQSAPNAAELQARLAHESQAKEEEAAALRQSQQEWQQRNHDLDAKIQALEHLIQRLQTAPQPATAPAAGEQPAAVATSVAPPLPTPPPTPTPPRAAAPTMQTDSSAPTPSAFDVAAVKAGAQELAGRLAQGVAAARERLSPHLTPNLLKLLAGALGVLVLVWLGNKLLGSSAPEPYQANGRWGFAKGDEPVIEAKYDAVQPFQEDLAVVERDGAFGFVDTDGTEVVPPAYDALNPYAGGYARVRIGDLYTFIDEEGAEFSHYFYNAYDFAEGYAPVLDGRGWYYISGPDAGVPDQPRLFQEAYPFRNGLARVRLDGAYTFITPKHLTDPERSLEPFGRYEHATDFAEGRARVQQNGRTFFIDEDGDEVAE